MKKSIKIRLAVTYIVIMCLSLAVMLGVNSLFFREILPCQENRQSKECLSGLKQCGQLPVQCFE